MGACLQQSGPRQFVRGDLEEIDVRPQEIDLLDIERRWSYTMFLQVLGKYLDLKVEWNQLDDAFAYGRAALQTYAEWMARSERTYSDYVDLVAYPTESWPAQDMRKSCVFDFAVRYGREEDRARFEDRAAFFHRASLDSLLEFSTCTSTRALAVLLGSGALRAGFIRRDPVRLPAWPTSDWSPREPFVSQKTRVRRRLKTPRGLVLALGWLIRPSVIRRLMSREWW